MEKNVCRHRSVTGRSPRARNFCRVLLSGHCRCWSSLGIRRSQELGSGRSTEDASFLSRRTLEQRDLPITAETWMTPVCLDPPVSAKKFIFSPLTFQDWKRHSAFRTDRSKPAVGIDRPKVSHVAMISSTGAPAIDQNQPVGRDATKQPVVCILGPSLNFTVYLPRTCLSLIFLISQSPI
jgi:hypothetical protein